MLKYLFTALGMFTKIPVKKDWEPENGARALCFFPFCGSLCGGISALFKFVCSSFELNKPVSAFLMLISIFVICGFLHFDGFMDVCDAIFSSRDAEGKVRILKDSNVGAFSVICVVVILIGYCISFFVVFESLSYIFILLVPVMSRAIGSFILFNLPPLSDTGILAYFRSGKKNSFSYLMAALWSVILLVFFFEGIKCFISALTASVCVFLLAFLCKRSFAGINGDVIGACVTFFEFTAYFTLAIIL